MLDAVEEVAITEFSNAGGFEETLSSFGDVLGSNVVVGFGLLLNVLFLNVGGELEDFSHVLSKDFVVSLTVGLSSLSSVLHHRDSVDEEVISEQLEVLGWVLHDVHGLVESRVVPGGSVDGLASWDSLLDLLDSSYDGDDSSNKVGDVLCLVGSHEFVVGSVEDESSLVLLVDALEEGFEVEGSTERLDDSLGNFSNLDFGLRLFSEDGLGSSHTDVFSEVSPVLDLVISDGSVDLMVDILSVNKEVLTNVISQ